ncbi:hypothetical protein ABEB36_009918 [Hypothenemus hampei]|uniref:Zinc finger PHD-type domain-containing protein n=1 Tax=Hypothenemus hampei TaxID=57062 RepID=A0ABD1EIE3_HYPHA
MPIEVIEKIVTEEDLETINLEQQNNFTQDINKNILFSSFQVNKQTGQNADNFHENVISEKHNHKIFSEQNIFLEEIRITNRVLGIPETASMDYILASDINMAYDDVKANNYCCVCERITTDLIKCDQCKNDVHSSCGNSSKNNAYICGSCKEEHFVQAQRLESYRGQNVAANYMMKLSKSVFSALNIGETIVLAVPKYDRGPLDKKNRGYNT